VKTLEVGLGERTYPIHIGTGLIGRAGLIAPHVRGRRAAIVTSETVGPLYLDRVRGALGNVASDVFVMPDGEAHKTLDTYGEIMNFLMTHRHDRRTTLIALGGGVVGDITGFAAATWPRGVDFVQVPTTLLAQVDSSVGGKTAVNHPAGKNMIGAFHQPRCVIADIATLDSLPARELAAGLAEVVKYGVIRDAGFFTWLEDHADELIAREPAALTHAVETSCRTKAAVVEADEREQDLRAILNFGHTFGHALETVTGYGTLLHGEAIAIGMVMAARASVANGMLDERVVPRIEALLMRLGLPVAAPGVDRAALEHAMGMDKKAVDGRVRLVLARALGEVEVTDRYGAGVIAAGLGA
jgi:3-dehydroquinate synthase